METLVNFRIYRLRNKMQLLIFFKYGDKIEMGRHFSSAQKPLTETQRGQIFATPKTWPWVLSQLCLGFLCLSEWVRKSHDTVPGWSESQAIFLRSSNCFQSVSSTALISDDFSGESTYYHASSLLKNQGDMSDSMNGEEYMQRWFWSIFQWQKVKK